MNDEKLKEVGREEIQDEILSILFNYLITENEKKDEFIQKIWKEKTRGDDK